MVGKEREGTECGEEGNMRGAYVAQPGCALLVGPLLWVCGCVSVMAGGGLLKNKKDQQAKNQ
jgi:hypothetical protein